MYDYEKRIEDILSRPITVSKQFENAIDTAFIKKGKKANSFFNNFSLKFATAALCFILTFSTVVFAAYIIYENIWKDPERTSRKQREESVLAPIDEEELKDVISEDDAKRTATTIVENLGYENKTISEVKLNRSYENNEDMFYNIVFGDVTVKLDAKSGVVDYIEDVNTRKLISDNDVIDDKKAIEIANEIYKSVGIGNIEDYLVLLSKEKEIPEDKYINTYWTITYGLEKGDLKLDDKIFTIAYKIIDENVYIHKLSYRKLNDFVNNPIIITKDEAIKIATDKEKEFSSLEISNISAEIDMKKMNTFVYILENKLENDPENIFVNGIKRNVWVVYIEHKKESKPKDVDNFTAREEFNKKFYIDATTGEIIGGEQAEYNFDLIT